MHAGRGEVIRTRPRFPSQSVDSMSPAILNPDASHEKKPIASQLRALVAGMRIDFGLVDAVPLGVDTPEELERARTMLAGT